MLQTTLSRAATTAALLGVVGLPALGNHIDFVSDDSNPGNGVTNATFTLSAGAGQTVMDTQIGEPDDILGGTRAVTLTNDGFGQTSTAEKVAGTDFISVTSDNVAAATLTLDYADFENADFASQWNRIDVAIPFLGQLSGVGDGEFDAFLTVVSSAGSGTAASGRIEASVTGGSTVLSFGFDDPAFAAVDFSDVDQVTLVIDSAIIGTDFQVGAITREGVPEPGSLALLAAAGLLTLRRRRA